MKSFKSLYLPILAVFTFLSMALMAVTVQKNHTPSIVKTGHDSKLGDILTDSKGMTLYIFTSDKENQSNCYDQCAQLWPPFLVKEHDDISQEFDGKLGIIDRRDDTHQVTFNGKPLYYYAKDKKPGDTYGQNVDKKWFVIKLNKSKD